MTDATKDLLRFITCGSVDDGKSTLIGRMLLDCGAVYDDQLKALATDSARYGTAGKDLDAALLVDGLEAERQQGITIDVAYRFFSTSRRAFMVGDTPGHEQYTRNMATAASTAELAVLLVDARKGLLLQTKRHAFICSLLGVRHILLAINKIDLVGYEQKVFDDIAGDFAAFASDLKFVSIAPIPISARFGDNVIGLSNNTSWYRGLSLLGHLEDIDIDSEIARKAFRFPIQLVNRPTGDFRGYSGTVASGKIAVGQAVIVASSGRVSQVKQITTYDGDLMKAEAGEAVTIVLEDDLDLGRGDILAESGQRPTVADQFAATIVWMDEDALVAGRSYLLKVGTQSAVPANITAIRYKLNVNSGEHLAATNLAQNEIGFCNVATSFMVNFDPYEVNRNTGAFIVVDRYTNRTVGAGMITFALRRASNIVEHHLTIGKQDRARLKGQKPCILWLTGLSGAGKSTIADHLDRTLFGLSRHTVLLDGDNVRLGLNRDLGFTEAGRAENIRRVGEVAKLMLEAGLIVICSFISPYRAERDMVRGLVGDGEFIEVFVDTPIEECMRRDPKGLYAKAKAGAIKNFTGIDSRYETPTSPELQLSTVDRLPGQLVEQIIQFMIGRGIISQFDGETIAR